MSPDMAGFGFGFENRPVRGPGLQKYGNTSIPVFPKPRPATVPELAPSDQIRKKQHPANRTKTRLYLLKILQT